MTTHDIQPGKEMYRMVPLLVMLALLVVLAVAAEQMITRSPNLFATVVRSVVVEKTNENRAQHAVGTLKTSNVLQAAAQRKAEDMATKGYFAHVSPEGRTPWYWFDLVGYRFSHAGENLAVRFSDSSAIVRAWMGSEGHRANILNAHFSEVGIGIASGTHKGKKALFVVQLFGTPLAASARPLPVAESNDDPSVRGQTASLGVWGESLASATPAPRSGQGYSMLARIGASPVTTLVWACLLLGVLLFVLLARLVLRAPLSTHRRQVLLLALLVALCIACALLIQYGVFSPAVIV